MVCLKYSLEVHRHHTHDYIGITFWLKKSGVKTSLRNVFMTRKNVFILFFNLQFGTMADLWE